MSNAKEKIKEIATKEQKDAMKEMLQMVDKSVFETDAGIYTERNCESNGWKLYGCAEK